MRACFLKSTAAVAVALGLAACQDGGEKTYQGQPYGYVPPVDQTYANRAVEQVRHEGAVSDKIDQTPQHRIEPGRTSVTAPASSAGDSRGVGSSPRGTVAPITSDAPSSAPSTIRQQENERSGGSPTGGYNAAPSRIGQ